MCDNVCRQLKTFNNAIWLKIFYHDIIQGGNFTNEEEALHSLNPYKFSILKDIENYGSRAQYDGKFEFLLEYPNLSSGYNWWRQAKFPTLEYDNISRRYVEGYESVSISWASYSFGGLAKTTRILIAGHIQTLLDGSIGYNTWYYAIGKYGYQYGNTMPAFDNTATEIAVLWMRINSIKIFNPCTYFKHIYLSKSLFMLFLPLCK